MLRMGMEEVNLDSGCFDLVWNGIALQMGSGGMACCDNP